MGRRLRHAHNRQLWVLQSFRCIAYVADSVPDLLPSNSSLRSLKVVSKPDNWVALSRVLRTCFRTAMEYVVLWFVCSAFCSMSDVTTWIDVVLRVVFGRTVSWRHYHRFAKKYQVSLKPSSVLQLDRWTLQSLYVVHIQQVVFEQRNVPSNWLSWSRGCLKHTIR